MALKKIFLYLISITLILILLATVIVGSILIKNIGIKHNGKDESAKQLSRTISQIIDDVSEIRTSLELPQFLYEQNKNFYDAYSKKENSDTSLKEILNTQVESVISNYKRQKLHEKFQALLQENNISSMLKAHQLDMQQKGFFLYIKYKGSIVATLEALLEDDTSNFTYFSISSPIVSIKTPRVSINNIDAIAKSLQKNIQANIGASQKIRKDIVSLLQNNEIRAHIDNGHFQYLEYNNIWIWRFYTILEELILKIEIHPLTATLRIQYDEYKNYPPSKALKKVKEGIFNTNFSVKEIRKAYTLLESFQSIISNANIQKLFEEKNIAVLAPREDEEYIYLDIVDTITSQKLGAFGIQKSNARLWITDADYILLQSFSALSIQDALNMGNGKEIIAVIGSHEGLADTIILAVLNKEKNSIELINIPRDLYYSGQKINWYFKRYSNKNFVALLSEVLGVTIHKYINVDMYAFVHIVDALGGIPVYLQEDIIDTTYKVKENNTWSTLYYPKGEYVLNGIEVLRVIRSRHSTSDFGRSERQQAVIEGFQKKLNDVNTFSSTLSIFKVLGKIRSLVTTNMEMKYMAKTIIEYKNSPIKKHILSTNNVLYYTFSNLHQNNLQKEDVGKDYPLGQYILLPRNDDWDAFRNYLQNIIK